MTTQLTEWLEVLGFEKVANTCRLQRGNLRVYMAIDEVVLLAFVDDKRRMLAWELRFAAPEGRLSVPLAVVKATVAAACSR